MKALLSLVFAAAISPGAMAAEFAPYPGASLNEQLTKVVAAELARASPTAQRLYGKPEIFTTAASFNDVLSFYKKLGAREFTMRTPWTSGPHEETIPAKLVDGAPQGGVVFNKAILVFDDAPEPYKSKCWVEISHPVAGKLVGKKIGDIEPITSITYVDKRPLR